MNNWTNAEWCGSILILYVVPDIKKIEYKQWIRYIKVMRIGG